MTAEEMRWLIGVSLAFLGTIGGMLIGAFRSLSGKIDKGNDELARSIKAGDDHLHDRVNRVRDEYVRSVDLDKHLSRLDLTLKEVRDEQREMNRVILSALPKPRGTSR